MNKINGIQRLGVVLILIGLVFLVFPVFVGTTAVLIMAGAIVGIGIFLLITTYPIGSTFLNISSIFIILMGIIIFFNPGILLFFIGISLIITGISNLISKLSRLQRNIQDLIYPIILIVLGGFAAFNTKAAIATIFVILGILSISIGILLITQDNGYIKIYSKRYEEDVIDVEYHEKK